MSTTLKVEMADDAYVATQKLIETIATVMLDPKGGLGAPTLDLFIERADRAIGLGPILHPSEFQAGAAKLNEVLEHARALRRARDEIARTAS